MRISPRWTGGARSSGVVAAVGIALASAAGSGCGVTTTYTCVRSIGGSHCLTRSEPWQEHAIFAVAPATTVHEHSNHFDPSKPDEHGPLFNVKFAGSLWDGDVRTGTAYLGHYASPVALDSDHFFERNYVLVTQGDRETDPELVLLGDKVLKPVVGPDHRGAWSGSMPFGDYPRILAWVGEEILLDARTRKIAGIARTYEADQEHGVFRWHVLEMPAGHFEVWLQTASYLLRSSGPFKSREEACAAADEQMREHVAALVGAKELDRARAEAGERKAREEKLRDEARREAADLRAWNEHWDRVGRDKLERACKKVVWSTAPRPRPSCAPVSNPGESSAGSRRTSRTRCTRSTGASRSSRRKRPARPAEASATGRTGPSR
jgi:hypothetical protein